MNAELVKQHPFMDEQTGDVYRYYRVPKQMLNYGKKLGITTDETLLYTVLRDRVTLSLQNGKVDEHGRIYIYYSREKAAECLGWSKRKAIQIFQRLVEHGLLLEQDEFSPSGKMLGRKLFIKLWQDIGFDFSLDDINNKNFKFATAKTLEETSMGNYYRLPVTLVEDERYRGLPLRSILLYMIILDRISLSKKYGRVDSNGLLWTTIDPTITGEELGCSARSLSRSFSELEEIGLIVRRAVEYAERWRIYARDFAPPHINPAALPSPTPACHHEENDSVEDHAEAEGTESTYPPSAANFAPLSCQICTPDTPTLHGCDAKSAPHSCQSFTADLPNLHPNQLSSNQPSFNYPSKGINLPGQLPAAPEVKILSSKEKADIVLSAYSLVHYDDVLSLIYSRVNRESSDSAVELLDSCHALILADLMSRRLNILFGNRSILRQDVINQYERLSSHAVYLLIEKTLARISDVKDVNAYLHWGLFTAADHHKGESYYLKHELGY